MGTSDRRPYLAATTLNQGLLNDCQDNLTGRLEMICDVMYVGQPAEVLRISDRSKYVDGNYYQPRCTFPVVDRTLGDWLSDQLEFSSLQLKINNSDGLYNHLLPGGSAFNGFVGKQVFLKVGIGEIGSTYTTIFSGRITDVGGWQRDTSSFTLICRQDFEQVNVDIPNQVFVKDDWPYLEDELVGLGIPIIYGDWTVFLRTVKSVKNNISLAPEVRCFVVNGLDPLVNQSLEDPAAGSVPLKCVIASSHISFLDLASVTLFRGDSYYLIPQAQVSIFFGEYNRIIEITQNNPGFVVDDNPWIFNTGDEFFIKAKGVDLGSLSGLPISDNIVMQAKHLLLTYGGLNTTNFDSSWEAFAGKYIPIQSAIANFKSRVWIQEGVGVLNYALSMLEQVRLEAFVNRDNKFQISSLHFDDFEANPSFGIKNWDVVLETFQPQISDQINFNRASADYAYSPIDNANKYSLPILYNPASVAQAGRAISKVVTFPNLYLAPDVILNLQEILKLASSFFEIISVTLTSRAFLLELGQDVRLDVSIGAVDLVDNVLPTTAKIRSIGYDPNGLVIPIKLWSFQLVPFPGNTKAGKSGIVGGYNAVIIQDT